MRPTFLGWFLTSSGSHSGFGPNENASAARLAWSGRRLPGGDDQMRQHGDARLRARWQLWFAFDVGDRIFVAHSPTRAHMSQAGGDHPRDGQSGQGPGLRAALAIEQKAGSSSPMISSRTPTIRRGVLQPLARRRQELLRAASAGGQYRQPAFRHPDVGPSGATLRRLVGQARRGGGGEGGQDLSRRRAGLFLVARRWRPFHAFENRPGKHLRMLPAGRGL